VSQNLTAELARAIEQIAALAQTGLAFNHNTFDAERYEKILQLASELAAHLNGDEALDADLAAALNARWRAEVQRGVPGYVTAKVGVGAVVFNDRDEILLIQRAREKVWLFPTGWADVGYTPAQVAAKEVLEETGLRVTPLRIIGIYDSWHSHINPDIHFYSIVFYCRLDGGELKRHPLEVSDVGFFARDRLPAPLHHANSGWVEHAFAAHRGETRVYFD
jgi:ADP-ribose pyrophosphatase YjhB (NUDIX family)